jgi:hypothetical protein
MRILQSSEINSVDVKHFAWTGLRRFQNVIFTEQKLIQYQNPPDSQKRNIRKQATQIRYCLNQAEEYFRAASSVSISTKPLLLYYGAMSLALAEILIKQSGGSSLDRARGQHAHHGLDLRCDANPSTLEDLRDSASSIRAVPLQKGSGERFGTFELWHRTSRETPHSGIKTVIFENNTAQSQVESLAIGNDERPELLRGQGVTLLDCFRNIPDMYHFMYQCGIVPEIVRGKVELTIDHRLKSIDHQTILHPGNESVLNKVYDRFEFEPSIVSQIHIRELKSGCIISNKRKFDDPQGHSKSPFGFQVKSDELFFSSSDRSLNEFGLIYVSLFMLGNYARYYPDQWMVDVERSSILALASTEFMAVAETRLPILVLSEMMQTYHLV